MTRDTMTAIMHGLSVEDMRRAEESRGLSWDDCWPVLVPSGDTWCVDSVVDSEDADREGDGLVPVSIGDSLRLRRCEPGYQDAFVRRGDAMKVGAK